MCKTTDELTKNHREDDGGFDKGVIYEKPGPNCRVASFELYQCKLSQSSSDKSGFEARYILAVKRTHQ